MRRHSSIPLRRWLPLFVVLAIVLLSSVSALWRDWREMNAADSRARELVKSWMVDEQHDVEQHLRARANGLVVEELAQLGSVANVVVAALVDDQGRVVASSQRLAVGRPMSVALPAFDATLLRQAQRSRSLVMNLDAARDHLLAYQPIALQAAPGQIRASSVGGLLLSYDLASAKAAARYDALMATLIEMAFAFVVMAAVMLMLRRWLSQPLEYLTEAVSRISQGDYTTEVEIPGHGELAELGAAVGKMEDELRAVAEERARHVEALRASEQDLATTLLSIGDAVIATDATGLITRMNPTAERLTGWPLADAAGRALSEVFRTVDGQTRVPSTDPVARVLARGEVVGLGENTTLLARDGEEYQIADSAAPIRDATGQMKGVVLVFSDVTEQHRVRQQLATTAGMLQRTGAMAKVGGWELDLRTSKLYWSLETFHIHDLEPPVEPPLDEAINFYAPEDRPAIRAAVQDAIDHGTPYDVELQLITARGRRIWVRAQCSPVMEDGKAVRLRGAFHDISERRRAEASRQESEDKFRYVFDHSSVGKSITLPSGEVQANAALAAMLGRSPEELRGLRWQDLTHPEDIAATQREMDALVNGASAAVQYTKRFLRKDGAVVWTQVNSTLRRDAAGAPLYFMTSAIDITERVQAEAALRESEYFFRESQRVAHIGSYRTDFVAGMWKSSEVLDEIFGIDEHYERSVSGWEDIIHPDDREMMDQYLRDEVLGQGRAFDRDYRIVRKSDGAVRWVHGLGALETDRDGNVVTMTGTIQDVTERKQAEETLRRDEARFRSMASVLQHRDESTHDFLDFALGQAVDLTRSKFGYLYYYNADQQRFVLNSWSGEAMKSCAITDPQTCYELLQTGLWGEAVRQRRPILLNDFVAEHPLKKGFPEGHAPLHNFLTIPVFLGGQIVAVVGVANKDGDYDDTDIEQLQLLMNAVWKVVEHRKTEEALRESELRLRDITSSMGDWVWEVDEHGVYTYSSVRGVELLGDVVGKTPFAFMPEEEATRVRAVFRDVAARRAPVRDLENWNIGQDGEAHCMLTNGVPILDADGRLKGYRGVNKDITGHKRAEQEKARLGAQLQQSQKMESVGRLAGGVAHDFNNMLTVILGRTELVLLQTDAAQPIRAHLQEIEEAAKRSAGLTRQLLAFARKQTVAPRVLDLNDIVSGMLKMLQRLIGEDIDLRWQPKAELWPVRIDPSQVDQVLANLFVNSRDAIAGVGQITIETGHRTFTEADCAKRPDFTPGEYVMLAVSDSGCGMDHETLAHLFEPFFTTKSVGQGTGLGLATVYGIVRQNDGFIEAYSELAHGTSFRIYLPRHVGQGERARVAEQLPVAARGHETVLVAEDEPSILALTAEMLEQQGYTVLRAASPGEAIRLAKEYAGEIHMLLTDVVMPEMNGRDLARNVLALHPQVKRLFMSGYTADVIAHRGVLDDGVHFIQKPFSMDTLTTKVREALDEESAT